eukprot:9033339-Alexandrium_andersonii.AAC.1
MFQELHSVRRRPRRLLPCQPLGDLGLPLARVLENAAGRRRKRARHRQRRLTTSFTPSGTAARPSS